MADPSSRSRRFSRRTGLQAGVLATAATGMAAVSGFAQEASPAASAPAGITTSGVEAAVAAIPAYIESLMDETGVPGIAISAVFNDATVYAAGFGVREVGVDGAVDADTVFQLASVSKPVGATVVSSMVGEGLFTWDTSLADLGSTTILSDAWVSGEVTLADLYSHRSGLPDHVLDVYEDLGADRDQVLHALRYVNLVGRFRDSYAYTNFGLTAAAVAAANYSGSTWEEASVARLYEPAGMTRTTSVNAEFVAMDNRAVGHVLVDGEWQHVFDRQPDAQSPAGGVSSSANDMARWMRLELNLGELDGTQILAPEGLQQTRIPHAISQMPEDPSTERAGFYGLGWNVSYQANGEVQVGHSGAFASGAGTTVYLLPDAGLGVTVLTNAFPLGVAESIALTFLDIARYGEPRFDYFPILKPILERDAAPLYGNDVASPPEEVRPPAAPESYLGTYESDVFGPLDVVEDGEHLAMILGPVGMQFPLAHYSRDVFTYMPPGENGGVESAVTFTLGADGIATQVVLENLDLNGAGTFTRPSAEGAE